MFLYFGHLSAPALGLVFLGGFVAVAMLCVVAVHRLLPGMRFDQHQADFGQMFGGAIATLFALVFALVTISVWQNYDRVNTIVSAEANSLQNIYRYLDSYPPAVREPSRRELRAYLRRVVDAEWLAQETGGEDPVARRLIMAVNARLSAYRPASLGDLPLHSEVLAQLSLYRGLRHDRILGGIAYLDSPMLLSLVIGSVILLCFFSLWKMDRLWHHLLMAAALGASLATLFYLMLVYNQPFLGPGAIDPAPFSRLLDDHLDD